jgi:hypothetical protein
MLVRRLVAEDPSRREAVERITWRSSGRPDAAFAVCELVAEKAIARADWPVAAEILQQFVAHATNHIPALMRLIEVCVDGDLEGPMYAAQAQLTDAYIAAGSAAEARFLAEDLVARELWSKGISTASAARSFCLERRTRTPIAERLVASHRSRAPTVC